MGLAHHLEEDKQVRGGKPVMTTGDLISLLIKYMQPAHSTLSKKTIKGRGNVSDDNARETLLKEGFDLEHINAFLATHTSGSVRYSMQNLTTAFRSWFTATTHTSPSKIVKEKEKEKKEKKKEEKEEKEKKGTPSASATSAQKEERPPSRTRTPPAPARPPPDVPVSAPAPADDAAARATRARAARAAARTAHAADDVAARVARNGAVFRLTGKTFDEIKNTKPKLEYRRLLKDYWSELAIPDFNHLPGDFIRDVNALQLRSGGDDAQIDQLRQVLDFYRLTLSKREPAKEAITKLRVAEAPKKKAPKTKAQKKAANIPKPKKEGRKKLPVVRKPRKKRTIRKSEKRPRGAGVADNLKDIILF